MKWCPIPEPPYIGSGIFWIFSGHRRPGISLPYGGVEDLSDFSGSAGAASVWGRYRWGLFPGCVRGCPPLDVVMVAHLGKYFLYFNIL